MSELWGALVPAGLEAEFGRELEFRSLQPTQVVGNLYLFQGPFVFLSWSAVHWRNLARVEFSSISAAVRELKPRARRWRQASPGLHRRSLLILDQLRAASGGAWELGLFPSEEGLGVFALTSENELVCTKEFDRPDPAGLAPFQETRAAPSRAYLKLWEALTLAGELPRPGERCLDLGSCPGGWTWVLASLGAQVRSVDRAPLDPRVAAMPGVEWVKGDAFALKPGPVDWLCSDVICYPERLLELVHAWEGQARRMVCTLKFQGDASPALVEEFRRLGRVLHLHHNKHELTFLKLAP